MDLMPTKGSDVSPSWRNTPFTLTTRPSGVLSVNAWFRQQSASVLRYPKRGTRKISAGSYPRYEKTLLQLPWLPRRMAPAHFCRHFRGTRIPGELDHSEDPPSQVAAVP